MVVFPRFGLLVCEVFSVGFIFFRSRLFELLLVRSSDLIAVMGGQPLERRAGKDRKTIGVMQADAGFEDIFRAEADDEPTLRSQVVRRRQLGKRFLPAVEGFLVESLHFVILGSIDGRKEYGTLFIR